MPNVSPPTEGRPTQRLFSKYAEALRPATLAYVPVDQVFTHSDAHPPVVIWWEDGRVQTREFDDPEEARQFGYGLRDQRDAAEREEAGSGSSEGSEGGEGDQPPNNPAVQIGEAVAVVEGATAEVAETVAEAGEPEVAAALESEVASRLDMVTQEVAAAAETVEVVAEQMEQATPPNTPEGQAATEAVQAAGEATEAVEVAEDAVAEVTRTPEVRPDSEHWYYRPRFRRRAKS